MPTVKGMSWSSKDKNSVRTRVWKTRQGEQIIGFIRQKNPTFIDLRGPGRSGWRRWVSTVPGEHCQKIAISIPTQAGQWFIWTKTWCDRQQLWMAVITGDTVARLFHSYPRSRLITWRGPEVKFGRNVVKKKKTQKNYQDEEKSSAINKKLILRLRSLISKCFQLKTITNSVRTPLWQTR